MLTTVRVVFGVAVVSVSFAGVYGGATYDALILAAARKGHASRLLTLEARDFLRLDPDGVEVVVPGA